MPLGDDDRRKKSKQHREAAFARWENKSERVARKTKEGTVDAVDGAVATVTAGPSVPGVGLTDRVAALGALLLAVPFWLWRQVRGTLANVWAFLTWLQFDYFLPPAITDNINWGVDKLWEASGLRGTSRRRQVASATVILVVAFLSTVVTGGAAIAVYIFALILLSIGLWRFVPAFNTGFKAVRSRIPVRDDYDAPFWSKK